MISFGNLKRHIFTNSLQNPIHFMKFIKKNIANQFLA